MVLTGRPELTRRVDFSIVIPTFQRRELVALTVRALARQEYSGPFEVIVVVDGSTDDSADALRSLELPFPLTVLEQPNMGIAAARNRGAASASGRWLLFLDDDMEADPKLLSEHARSHAAGADAVTGHVPLSPASPHNFLSASVKAWAEDRARQLRADGSRLDFLDIVGGQLSLDRALFTRVGGFDTDFTRNGTFGNEDRDLACRLIDAGYSVAFNPDAVSWQTYIVTPGQFLRNYRQAGVADVHLAAKYPLRRDRIFNPECVESRMDRLLWRRLRLPIRWMALRLVDGEVIAQWRVDFFFWAWRLEYCQGVRDGTARASGLNAQNSARAD